MYLVFGYRSSGMMEFFGTTKEEPESNMIEDVVTLPEYLLCGGSFNALKHPDISDMWYIHVGSKPLIHGDGTFDTPEEAERHLRGES